ncbi:MAG: AAA family ATPase [Pirellulaceae bacterium]|nr:AAA family ATPase [Pirellulaceae bacterium]
MPRKPKSKARRTLIYGADGIDKSAWAAKWPKPLFLDIGKRLTRVYESDSTNWKPTFPELDFLGIDGGKPYFESLAFEGDDALPKAAEIIARLGSIEPEANWFRTLVIDSAESLSNLIFKKTEQERLAELRTAEPMAAVPIKGAKNRRDVNSI